jgi:hypothetical protein
MASNGHLAAAFERLIHGALGKGALTGGGVGER